MRRGLAIVLFLIVMLFVVAIVVVYTSIGSVITTTIEEYGSAVTGTKVTLQEANFSPVSGDATLVRLSVNNPPNYSDNNAFYAASIDMQIDPKTVGDEVLVIKRLKIDAPEIFYEIRPDGDNLRVLRANIKAAIENPHLNIRAKSGMFVKKFIVNDFYLTNGVVIVQSDDLTGKKATALLEPIHLEDLGKDENGLTPAGLVDKIYRPILKGATLSALSTDLNLSDQAQNILRAAGDETEEVLDRIKKLFGAD